MLEIGNGFLLIATITGLNNPSLPLVYFRKNKNYCESYGILLYPTILKAFFFIEDSMFQLGRILFCLKSIAVLESVVLLTDRENLPKKQECCLKNSTVLLH